MTDDFDPSESNNEAKEDDDEVTAGEDGSNLPDPRNHPQAYTQLEDEEADAQAKKRQRKA